MAIKISEKGIMLISVLLLTVLLVIMAISMVIIATESLNLTGQIDNKTRAQIAADAGIEFVRSMLNADPNWNPASDVNTIDIGNGEKFAIIANDPPSGYHTCNNLNGSGWNGTTLHIRQK